MKNTLAITFFLLACITYSCREDSLRTINENTEWSHSWMVRTGDTLLPRVLIIGDSHVERYFPLVSSSLNGLANVCKFTTSKSLGDPILLDQIELIIKQYDFDLISFNNGLHGRSYEESEYSDHLPQIVNKFRQYSDAEIILVNTTPARVRGELDTFQDFNLKVIERNKIFSDFAQKNNLHLMNFYSLGESSTEFYTPDGIHFNPEGVKEQARLISNLINKTLD